MIKLLTKAPPLVCVEANINRYSLWHGKTLIVRGISDRPFTPAEVEKFRIDPQSMMEPTPDSAA